MPDILIRDVPAEDIARIDAHARRQGLSRTEYLRRKVAQDAERGTGSHADVDWDAFAERTQGLRNEDLMRQAWS